MTRVLLRLDGEPSKACVHLCRLALLLAAIGVLQGCAGVVVGGAATSVAVAADSRTTGTVIEDQAIELKAAKAMLEDEELRQKTHVNVTSYNMLVLVSGEAPTEELRSRVIDLVRRIDKVRHVYDELTIAAPSSMLSRSSDGVITAKVKTKLLGLKDFDGTRVKVVTENGVVYLMGLISDSEGERAAAAARTVGGVQKVVKLFESGPT
jgi:osmotically-inducible protein OsmY